MSEVLFDVFRVAIVLACPLMMVFMMRGMGHGEHQSTTQHAGADPREQRIADLEREVARMRSFAPITVVADETAREREHAHDVRMG